MGEMKTLLEIPTVVLLSDPDGKIDPGTLKDFIESVKLGPAVQTPEMKLFTAGSQGGGKTTVAQSLGLEAPRLSEETFVGEERKTAEFTVVMQEHQLNLKRGDKVRIEVKSGDRVKKINIATKGKKEDE